MSFYESIQMYLDKQKLSQRIDAYLKVEGNQLQHLSAASSLSTATIRRLVYKHSTVNPRLETLNALAKALGCTAHDLVS